MRKKIKIRSQILVMLAAVILGCTVVSFAQTTDELLARAFKSYKKQDYAAATADINAVLKSQPKNATAFYYLGVIAFANAKYDEAIADHTKAIEYDPTTPQFNYERANAYIYKPDPDYKAAIADLSRAIELLPAYGDAYDQKGYSYLMLKDWAAAESNFTLGIKYGVNTKEIYINRGAARSNSDNYDQAAADYRKALEIDPNYEAGKTHLADALAMQEKIAKRSGIPQINAAIPKGSLEKPSEELNHAVDLINAGQFVEAEKLLNAFSKKDPNNAAAYYLYGVLKFKLKEFDLAHAAETLAIKQNPNVAEFYYLRGISRRYDPDSWQTDEQSSALSDFSKAIELNSAYAEAYHEKASISYYVFDESYWATRAAEEAVRLNPKDGESYFICGLIYVFRGDDKQAIQYFTQAINTGLERSDYYENRGYMYTRLGKRSEATADYQKAVALDGNNATAKENLNRLTAKSKGGFLVPTTPKPNAWAAEMRDLFKKYSDEASSANYWAHSAPKSNQSEICGGLSGWWTATHNANNYLTQLWSLSRREDEKKAFLERSIEADAVEKKASDQIRSHNCSF